MSDSELNAVSLLKLAASETRFNLLSRLIAAKQSGQQVCVNDLANAIQMSHSATSHQLSRLESSGVVTAKRNGQMVCYELAKNQAARELEAVVGLLKHK